MQIQTQTVTLRMIAAEEGKVLVDRAIYQEYLNNGTPFTGAYKIYLSDTDSADNYIEVDLPEEEEEEQVE